MREDATIRHILDYLNSLPRCKAIKINDNQRSESGTPDVFCSYRGISILFQIPRGKVSKVETHRLAQWREAGAWAYLVDSQTQAKLVIEAIERAIFSVSAEDETVYLEFPPESS